MKSYYIYDLCHKFGGKIERFRRIPGNKMVWLLPEKSVKMGHKNLNGISSFFWLGIRDIGVVNGAINGIVVYYHTHTQKKIWEIRNLL